MELLIIFIVPFRIKATEIKSFKSRWVQQLCYKYEPILKLLSSVMRFSVNLVKI